MRRPTLVVLAAAAVSASIIGADTAGLIAAQSGSASPQQPAKPESTEQRALLSRYCVTCHNERLKTAGVMLDTADVGNVPAGAEVWEKVIRKLRTGAMPPPGRPRPPEAAYAALTSWLESEIDRDAA